MSIKTLDVSDVSKVSLRDIYMRLCACRDFEIKLQWERAVFLTAFLIACFAGYGSFLLSVHQHGCGTGNFSPLAINSIFILLTVVGIVLSLFWILMAKGSKAWYEHYEQAIAAFAKNHATPDVPEYLMAHQWRDMPNIARNPMSDCIFDFKGGAYSVSKIVIAIGICSLVIWWVLFLIHNFIVVFGLVNKCSELSKVWKISIFLTVVAGIVIVLILMKLLVKKLASGYLGKMKTYLLEDNSDSKIGSSTLEDRKTMEVVNND